MSEIMEFCPSLWSQVALPGHRVQSSAAAPKPFPQGLRNTVSAGGFRPSMWLLPLMGTSLAYAQWQGLGDHIWHTIYWRGLYWEATGHPGLGRTCKFISQGLFSLHRVCYKATSLSPRSNSHPLFLLLSSFPSDSLHERGTCWKLCVLENSL